MAKNKDGKKHKKGSQFVIRVDKDERDAFVALCEKLDTSAAREVRRFMREWVAAQTASPEGAEPKDEAQRPDPAPEPAAPTVAAEDSAPETPVAAAAASRRKRRTAAV